MIDIIKYPEESEQDYLIKLYNLKETSGLTWKDLTEIANEVLGYNYSSDRYRKDSYKYIEQNNHYKETIEKDIDYDNYIKAKLEKVKLNDERTQINTLYRRIAREESLKEIALESVNTISEKIKLSSPPTIVPANKGGRVAILQLSDIHYGIEDKTMWNEYNPDIAKKRIQKLQNKVIEYLQKENIDTLYLVNLGDMVGGRIHLQLRLNSRIDVVTQAIEISEIISDFTNNLSEYAKIHCYFTTDNHGRLEPNIKDSIDLESLSRLIPWYMKERLKDNTNVILHIDNKYGDDIVTFKIFNYNIACCHGHKDNPTKIVSNISLYTKKHYDLILSSHFHHLALEEENETIVVYNGSILSTDTYAEKFRLNSKPSQNLIICSQEDVMECLYKINLN